MEMRDQALRRILEASGVELTEEQARELRAHLADAIEAKTASGRAELEAAGEAFAELGNLRKIAARFPGAIAWRWSDHAGAFGFALLLAFALLQTLITPLFQRPFAELKVALPGLTVVFLGWSSVMRDAWPLVVAALAGLALLLLRLPRRSAWRGALNAAAVLGGAALLGGALVGVMLPLLGLLQAVGGR